MVGAYRATPQETTGQTPNMVMLGREILMPIDLVAGTPPGEEPSEITEYGIELRRRMTQIHQLVRARSGREMERQKKLYDRGKTTEKYDKGDRVWERTTLRKKGRAPKLQRKWLGPRLIVRRHSDVTYLVASGPKKAPRVVHFDRLKQYNGEKHPAWMTRYLQSQPEEFGEPLEEEDSD